ncbi:PAS domain S-box protein [Geitlerinema sp. P-1104]|uniref:adenylate/guanylate cyclase domain-containing protein n=1 Tax=Geitlerinema sp. P-1104 TaxID=2546230 RepID=UPI001476BFF5|nr:adenylate/guanylate cyclase domain-containing protein [Geitlerinema sp. P-1104]NMG57179.1 PAS domain S-box protein [Geitlerinema sp. P-1104]
MTSSPVQRRNVMRDEDKPKTQLIQELAYLRQRVEALENQQQEAQQEPDESRLTDETLQSQLDERTAALVEANDQLVAEIVKHTQAEQALRSAKEQLEAVLDAVPGVVSWISRDLRYLGVNRQLAQMFNAEPENFIGKGIGFLRASHDFHDFMKSFFESNADDATCEVSTRVHGELRDFLIVAQKYDGDRAAFTVGIDITERRQAENDLRAAKDQLQAILEAVPGMVSWISSDLRYLGVNRHLAKTYNLLPEAFVDQEIGFLQTSDLFQGFLEEFFASEATEHCQEITAKVHGEIHSYLIAAQKYDEGRAAFTVGIDVTERHRAIQALKEAEAKYRTLFENAVEGIYQISPSGTYLNANPALARIYGYESPEDLINNLSCGDRLLYVDIQKRQYFLETLHQQGQVIGFEQQIYRQDGSVVWISENARLVWDNEGDSLLYYEGTVEDITERKRAEESLQKANEDLEIRVEERTAALRQANERLMLEIGERQRIEAALRNSEAELRALFQAMTDTITVFDAQGRYVRIVSTNSEVLYSPKQDRVGKSVYEVLPPTQASIFVSHIQRALNTGETVNLEYNLEIDDPEIEEMSEVWFAATVSPLPDNCVIWVARNITERRRVLNALQEAEEKYRSIFENAAEGIYQTTPEGQYVSANPALIQMYGYDSLEDLQANVRDVGRDLYVDRDRRLEFISRLEDEGSIVEFELQVYCKDGSVIWTSENARTVRDFQGRVLYYEGTVQEITKRKLAEEALRVEQEKSESLLLNVLPRKIAEQLKQDQTSIAERFEEATIMFADLVDFTTVSAQMTPSKLVAILNEIFSTFDQLALAYRLEKIKTIGDAYMVAGGLPMPMEDHAGAIAEMALEMQWAIDEFNQKHNLSFQLRIGINTGPVVAGVIGIRKFAYDLWGDTVNVASRMESQGQAGNIQVTQKTYEMLQGRYILEPRGLLDIKGRGKMMTYWLCDRLGEV